MYLIKRQITMIEMLFYVGSMTITEISRYFSVSRKTVYADLDIISSWFTKYDFGGLEKLDLGRYKVKVIDQASFEKFLFQELQTFHNYEVPERQAFLLFWLITTPFITIDELLIESKVSRNTLFNDLRETRKLLNNKKIKLIYDKNRYQIIGDELHLRGVLINVLGPYARKLIHANYLAEGTISIKQAISYNARDWLLVAFCIQDCRKRDGFCLGSTSFPWDQMLQFDKPKERCYEEFYRHCLIVGFAYSPKDSNIIFLCEGVTECFLSEVKNLTAYEMDCEAKEVIFMHMYPAIYRGFLGIVLQNPILGSIEDKYARILGDVESALRNAFPFSVSKTFLTHEASYLTSLVISHRLSEVENKPLIVVACYEGTSVSYSVKNQLAELGIDKDQIVCKSFGQLNGEVPILITTTLLPEFVKAKKWIKVTPIFTMSDRIKLQVALGNYMTQGIDLLLNIVRHHVSSRVFKLIVQDMNRFFLGKGVEVTVMLKDLLTRDMVQFVESVKDWEEAIDVAARPMLDSGKITNDYVKAVKENIHENGSYVVLCEEFALPHARPQKSVKELGMSLVVLKKELPFAKEELPVRVMVLLAAVDSSSHIDALAELIYLVSDAKRLEKIKELDNYKDFSKLIESIGGL